MTAYPATRRGAERRQTTWRTLVYAVRGRRKGARRADDPPAYPDHYGSWLFFSIVLLFILSLGDAFATLAWVDHGVAVEGNPVMAAILPLGEGVFVFYKFLLTVAGVSFLLYCYPFYRINLILAALNVIYLAVAVYHLGIFFKFVA
ncbi:MAG: DUF5658 family protein [Nitrospirota bacterium]|jgi:hypothetical protein